MTRRAATDFTGLMEQSFALYQYQLQWWEMMTASSMTIAMRLSGIGYKWQKNKPQDYTEVWRMFAEKNQAAWQSAGAAGSAQAALMRNWTFWPTGGVGAAGAPWANPLQFNKLMLDMFSNTLAPFHKASSANAFRLSGTRRPKS